MNVGSRDRIAAACGLLVGLGTLVPLIVTPPPPRFTASGRSWVHYLHAHEHGIVIASLMVAIGAVALVGLARRTCSDAATALAILAAAPMLSGAVVLALLAQQAQRVGAGAVVALAGTSTGLLYVAPAIAAAAFTGVVASGLAGRWRVLTAMLAAMLGLAGGLTVLDVSAPAATFAFAVRVLFAAWAAVFGLRSLTVSPVLARRGSAVAAV